MPNHPIVVPVQMDARTFRDFAIFDTMRRQKLWVRPAVFSGIMLAFAAVCFSQYARQGALLLGSVLAAVALGLPVVYFGSYFFSVRKQARQMGLATPKPVYRLCLSDVDDGVEVCAAGDQDKPEKALHCAWGQLYGAWRAPGAIYLYAQPGKAYILPSGQIQGSADALWALCQKRMPGKCHEMR